MICKSVEEFLKKYAEGCYVSDLEFLDENMYKELFKYCIEFNLIFIISWLTLTRVVFKLYKKSKG